MINKLVLENLKARWVRTFLSALVVGVQVMSILTLIGLSDGLLEQSANRAKGSGADIFLKPGAQNTFSLSSGQVLQKFVPLVAKQPHVAAAVPVLIVPVQVVTSMNGVDLTELERVTGRIRFLEGGPPKGLDDLLVDEYYAKQNKVRVGRTVRMLNHDWRVCGVIPAGLLGRFIVPLQRLQQLTGNAEPARISQILIKLDDPALVNQEVEYLNQLLKGNLQAISMSAFVSQFSMNSIPELKAFVGVITVISVVVGFLVVFLSMYTAVVERTREIGILKALGAKPLTILDILVREAIILAILGWIIGLGLSFAAKTIVMTFLPASLPVVTVPDWWPIAAAIAIVGALLGAVYPGLKAARQDAIEALAYE
ncbi:MAG: ABC transporter permease [Acidobacteriaceae bacterium]|nr:ABC transporter permease [Acidobacteriaceae bacterium]